MLQSVFCIKSHLSWILRSLMQEDHNHCFSRKCGLGALGQGALYDSRKSLMNTYLKVNNLKELCITISPPLTY